MKRAIPALFGALLCLSLSAAAASPRKAFVRDLDGDGKADLLWEASADGHLAAWLMNGTGIRAASSLDSLSGAVRFTGDFDGDGKTDLLLRDPDGRHVVVLMNGLAVRASGIVAASGLDWEAIAVGDFDGDGKADIAWKNAAGDLAIGYMNGAVERERWSILSGRPELSVAAVADFDGNGHSDILWSAADGSAHLTSFMSPGFSTTRQLIGGGSGWSPVFAADFNGDGHADIVWRHADGRHAAWYMDNPLAPGFGSLIDANTGWTLALVRDLDGDGKSDLVWRHANGSYAAWLMNGGTPKAYAVLLDAGTGWEIIRSEDFDGDGRDDLLFRNADGSHAMWLMNGLQAKSYRALFNGGSGWEAGAAAEGCDRTQSGSFRVVNPAPHPTLVLGSGLVYVERTPGTCGGAFTIDYTATFSPPVGDATSGPLPLGPGSIRFADGEPGIKSIRVTAGSLTGITYQLTLQSAHGDAGATAPATGTYTLDISPSCPGCPNGFLLDAVNAQQIVFGSVEASSFPPLKAGETIAAGFTFQPSPNGFLTISVAPVSAFVAGQVADLEVALSTVAGDFPATTSDSACDKRLTKASQSVGLTVLYGGPQFPGICPLVAGQRYYINIRQVSANYANGTTPSCLDPAGCALRMQPQNLN